MKFTFICFLFLMAVKTGIYLGDLSIAYFDAAVDKEVKERMGTLKNNKPAYCSFYQ